MTDRTELKRLAEAFPADLDWDSNTEPFFNVTGWSSDRPPQIISLMDGMGIPSAVIDAGGVSI